MNLPAQTLARRSHAVERLTARRCYPSIELRPDIVEADAAELPIMVDYAGTRLTPAHVRQMIRQAQAQGLRFLPVFQHCANPCLGAGCEGFDYIGRRHVTYAEHATSRCPGHVLWLPGSSTWSD